MGLFGFFAPLNSKRNTLDLHIHVERLDDQV